MQGGATNLRISGDSAQIRPISPLLALMRRRAAAMLMSYTSALFLRRFVGPHCVSRATVPG